MESQNKTVDVSNRLGGHVRGWLVVGRLEGGEFTLQERVNGTVLAWDDLKMLHSLATSENMEKVSQQLVVGNKFDIILDDVGNKFDIILFSLNLPHDGRHTGLGQCSLERIGSKA
jgi:hypothetical protein